MPSIPEGNAAAVIVVNVEEHYEKPSEFFRKSLNLQLRNINASQESVVVESKVLPYSYTVSLPIVSQDISSPENDSVHILSS